MSCPAYFLFVRLVSRFVLVSRCVSLSVKAARAPQCAFLIFFCLFIPFLVTWKLSCDISPLSGSQTKSVSHHNLSQSWLFLIIRVHSWLFPFCANHRPIPLSIRDISCWARARDEREDSTRAEKPTESGGITRGSKKNDDHYQHQHAFLMPLSLFWFFNTVIYFFFFTKLFFLIFLIELYVNIFYFLQFCKNKTMSNIGTMQK